MLVNPSRQYSSKDMPGQLHMKEREDLDQEIDFKSDLLERENLLKVGAKRNQREESELEF